MRLGGIAAMALMVLAGGLATAAAQGAPEVPEVSMSWELQVEIQDPRPVRLQIGADPEPQVFWYVPYRVVNRTGAEQIFIPEFLLYTDTGHLLRANQGVPPQVFQYLKSSFNDPLLRDQTGMTGRILQGEDNSRRGLAIFRNFDPEAGAFDLFVGGLSGETVRRPLPVPIEVVRTDLRGNPVRQTLTEHVASKTLRMRYQVRADATGRGGALPVLMDRRWIMR